MNVSFEFILIFYHTDTRLTDALNTQQNDAWKWNNRRNKYIHCIQVCQEPDKNPRETPEFG